MSAILGGQSMSAFRYGSIDLERLVLGSTVIWTKTSLYDGFDYPDGPLDPALWTHLGSSPGTYKLGVVDGAMRLAIPDNTMAIGIAKQLSRYRFNNPHPAANGFIETRVANIGKSDHRTHVFRRSSVDGADGVGMQLRAGRLHIVRRVGGTDTLMVDCGAIGTGDRIRMHQAGNLHSMFRNGRVVGEWDDSGATASSDAAHRSLMVFSEGSKDILGPRRFATSLDFVECS